MLSRSAFIFYFSEPAAAAAAAALTVKLSPNYDVARTAASHGFKK